MYISNNNNQKVMYRGNNIMDDLSQKSLLFLLLITVLVYIFTPMRGEVSMLLFYFSFGMMLLGNYIFFKAKRKENYLDFDTIFIVVYCLVGFTTTFFYHDIYTFRDIFLGFPVDVEYINKSNLLFLIGLLSYMVGSLSKFKKKFVMTHKSIINTRFLVILVFILIILFFISGGLDYYRSEYNKELNSDGAGIVKHVLLLLVTSAMALIGTEFYNKKVNSQYKISKIAFIAMFFVVGTLMMVGNRTAASQIVLPIICLYAIFFKSVNFKKFILFILVGIVTMWAIQRLRSKDEFELSNPVMLILDLTIPVRNTYAALKYVDTKDYTYGGSMVIDISGVIPFMPSLISESFPDFSSGSAEILTGYTFLINKTPDEVQIGLGTTIVADIFLSFGLIGVLLLMYLLGYYISKWSLNSLYLDYYSIIILCGMLGNAIFIVRASYFHPTRFVIWALFLAFLNKLLCRSWKR